MGWYSDYDEDFRYKKPKEPKPRPDGIFLKGPLIARSKRGEIGTEWWGKQWVSAINQVLGDTRLDRGKRYARSGAVTDMEIAHGQVFAHVQGSYGVYHTYIRLQTFTDTEWQRAIEALAAQAIYSAKLLAGEMPSDIEAIFEGMGTSLFPRRRKAIEFECSCPDWGDPCKHGAAVYYLLAEQFDADPFILFHLRGRSREWVLDQLKKLRGESHTLATAPTDTLTPTAPPLTVEGFWGSGVENLVRSSPLREKTPFVFRQLGAAPGHAQRDLEKVYEQVANEAQKWLGLE